MWHVELIQACDVAGRVVGGGDMAGRVVGGGDVVVGVDDNALAWPNWAFTRGVAGLAMSDRVVGWWWWVERM